MTEFQVFPIGHYLGKSDGGKHTVRVGQTYHELTEQQFRLWMLAHGPVPNYRYWWTGQDVLTRAAESGPVSDRETLDDLIRMGVLALVDDARRFTEHYRMHPLLIGLGHTADSLDWFTIGLPGRPVAEVKGRVFELWLRAELQPNLWDSCQRPSPETAGQDEPAEADAASAEFTELVDELLGDVRELLASHCAYLDLA